MGPVLEKRSQPLDASCTPLVQLLGLETCLMSQSSWLHGDQRVMQVTLQREALEVRVMQAGCQRSPAQAVCKSQRK